MRIFRPLRPAAAVGLLLLPLAAHAQFENGSLVGAVRDDQNAVIAGATITVTNLATGTKARGAETQTATLRYRSCAWSGMTW